jgi:nitroreductase
MQIKSFLKEEKSKLFKLLRIFKFLLFRTDRETLRVVKFLLFGGDIEVLRKVMFASSHLNYLQSTLYDLERYLKYNKSFFNSSTSNVANILEKAHIIEKGFSFKKVKHGFGIDKLKKLNSLKDIRKTNYGLDKYYYLASQALICYFNNFKDINWADSEFRDFPLDLIEENQKEKQAELSENLFGVSEISSESICFRSQGNFRDLSFSRHSIRDFADKDVDLELILEAVDIALRCPSQCNRQSSRLHIFRNREKIRQILELQGGAKGFLDSIPLLLVVTNDISCWDSPNERNQAYVDGGLFAMALVYALHYLKFGTCTLNLAMDWQKDSLFRKLTEVPDSEVFIMCIAVGHLRETVKVTKSLRRSNSEIVCLKD